MIEEEKGEHEAKRIESCCMLFTIHLLTSSKNQKNAREEAYPSSWRLTWKTRLKEKIMKGCLTLGTHEGNE